MFYLSAPFNFEARLAIKRDNKKNPAELYSTGFLYPIASMYSHKAFRESPRFRRNRLHRLDVTFSTPQA